MKQVQSEKNATKRILTKRGSKFFVFFLFVLVLLNNYCVFLHIIYRFGVQIEQIKEI